MGNRADSHASSLTTALLTVLLVLPGSLAGVSQDGSLDLGDAFPACEPERLKFPLWIESVDILDDEGSELAAMGFVESGDDLSFRVRFTNRVDPICDAPIYERGRTDDLAMEVSYLPDPDDEGLDRFEVYRQTNMRCHDGSQRDEALLPGQTCQMIFSLPGRDVEAHTSGIENGEQRIRFMIGDEGPCPYTGSIGAPAQSFDACKLAGAERVLVVDALPDLRPTGIEWLTPEDETERHTRYGDDALSTFEVRIENRGEYPAWAPNAPHAQGLYFERSSFDAPDDGDERPDERCADPAECEEYAGDDHELPPCQFESGASDDRPRCSYRRGAPLPVPVLHQVARDGQDRILEEGVTEAQASTGSEDKHRTLLHHGNEEGHDNEQTLDLSALNLRRKAGSYNLTVTVDQDADGRSFVPETNEADNDRLHRAEVFGVDLELESAGIVVEGQGGLACTTPEDPCPAGSTIIVDPTFTNRGDPESAYGHDPDVLAVDWSSAVWIKHGDGDWEIAQTGTWGGGHEPAVRNHSDIPARGQLERLFPNQPARIDTHPNGGVHWIGIRLDHPDNYLRDTPVSNPEGLVAERVDSFETEGCTLPIEAVDNAFCLPLYFEQT